MKRLFSRIGGSAAALFTPESKKKKKVLETLAVLFLFSILTFIFLRVNMYYLLTDVDSPFHRLRLLGLIQSIRNGDYFPEINYVMAKGLGYAVPLFYGQWYLYIPAFFQICFSTTFIQSWFILDAVFYISSLCINYFLALRFQTSKARAMSFSLLLVFNPMVTSIVNGDIPFAICLMLLPSLFFCLNKMIFENGDWIILSVIASVMVCTHVLSSFIAAFICLLWVLLNFKKLSAEILIKFAKTVLAILLMSSYFLLPMFEQIKFQSFKAFGYNFRIGSVKGLGEILINSLNNIDFSSSMPSISLLGVILLAYVLIYILKNKNKGHLIVKKLNFLIVFLIAFSSSVFPWIVLGKTIFGSVQFVSRYLAFALVLIILCAVLYTDISKKILLVCLVGCVFATISQQIFPAVANKKLIDDYIHDYKNGFSNRMAVYKGINNIDGLVSGVENVNGIAGGEYLNKDADTGLTGDHSVSIDGGEILFHEKNYGSYEISYDISSKNESATISLPLLYYKGYVAKYSNGGKGFQPFMKYDDKLALVKDGIIHLKVTESGSVKVFYQTTMIQIISRIVSLISLIGLVFIFTWRLRRKRRASVISPAE